MLAVLLLSFATLTFAQQKEPDVLVFTNGDKLTGTLERAAGDTVIFSLSASAVDSFINNPGFVSPGIPSKKNSVQFTTGLTYTLR